MGWIGLRETKRVRVRAMGDMREEIRSSEVASAWGREVLFQGKYRTNTGKARAPQVGGTFTLEQRGGRRGTSNDREPKADYGRQ